MLGAAKGGAAEHTEKEHVHDAATRSESGRGEGVGAGDGPELLRVCVSWVSGLETVAVRQDGIIHDIADAVMAEPGVCSVKEVFMHHLRHPASK